MNYHFEINKSNYSDKWSCPVHSLNCVFRQTRCTHIKFEVVYVAVNVNIVVLWDVLWQIPVFGRNLLPVCSFLHIIPPEDGGCKSTTPCGMTFQKALSLSARSLFNKQMAIYSNMIIETSMISKYDIFIHDIRSNHCNVLLHRGQYHRLWSTGAFILYFTSQDLPWLTSHCRATHQTGSFHFPNCVCRWRISCIEYVQVFVSLLWVVKAKRQCYPCPDLSPCHDDTTAVDDERFASHSSHITPRTNLVPTG